MDSMDELKKLSRKVDDLTRRVLMLEDFVGKIGALVEPPKVTEIRRAPKKIHRHLDGSEGTLPPGVTDAQSEAQQ